MPDPKPLLPVALTQDRPMTTGEMIETAARAVGRVLRDDLRALTSLSVDELVAMTGTLLALGLVPLLPGQPSPDPILNLIKRTET